MRGYLVLLLAILAGGINSVGEEAPLPDLPLNFLENHCLECHDELTEKGEINLDLFEVDWSNSDMIHLWERVFTAIESGVMPPEKRPRPDSKERDEMLAWIDKALTRHTGIGGTLARRLNRAEYQSTVKSLFDLKNFTLPAGFPADREYHGFDNVGKGLVLSPPLLEAYAETARLVADEIFPPPTKAPVRIQRRTEADQLTISYSSGMVVDGAMRLGMKCDPIQRSCTWPTRIEVEDSGVYTISVELSTFGKTAEAPPMIAKIFARDVASTDGVSHRTLRLLQEIEVVTESPRTFTFEAELYEGQTPVIHWANATLDSDRADRDYLRSYFERRAEETPGYLEAWNEMVSAANGQGFRGGVGWERVKKLMAGPELSPLSDKDREALLKKVVGNPVLYAETVVFEILEGGPALEIHGLEITGPDRIVEGPRDKENQRLRKRFLADASQPEEVIRTFLTRAYRRPADEASVATWLALHDAHLASGHTADEAMHLVIRNVLISPRFLYRSLDDGPMDDYDLATRLSYFLKGGPPDATLWEKAASGKLRDPSILRSQASRLLPKKHTDPLVVNFTGQWLDTRLLPDIMPDPQFKFSARDEQHARTEVEYLFSEILRENRPMTDFINPDFTWTSARIAKAVYGLTEGFDRKKTNTIHRVTLPRDGRYGGVLANSAVMMATANGVDTQPVMRGVWVLENILGTPPPPPPKAVPALTPDTQGATTPRELLSAHTAEESCAGCHKRIDPVGFVLENFDPVGRWRENWPGNDQPIDAASTLIDGTPITQFLDFKEWLVTNVDQFSECLAGHLMTYATGRVPNYAERKEIAAIVEKNHANGNGFRDLVLDLIESETFRTR